MRKSLGMCSLAALASACAISIDSAIPDSESLFDARLLGRWELPTESEMAEVTRHGRTGYTIEYTDGEGEYGRFRGRLGRLDGRLVLEVWPDEVPSGLSDGHTSLLLPAHLLFSIQLSETHATLSALDRDQLRDALERGVVDMPHLLRNNHLILTGTTEQLHAGLRSFVAAERAFADTATWIRPAAQ